MHKILNHWLSWALAAIVCLSCTGCETFPQVADLPSCALVLAGGFRPIADEPAERFTGKVRHGYTARCRGGAGAVEQRNSPYPDWSNYWGTGDETSLMPGSAGVNGHVFDSGRGIDGALIDLEYFRIELLKFNLHDNSGTYKTYVEGIGDVSGTSVKSWPEMSLPWSDPQYEMVDGERVCARRLWRFRNLDGKCNDIRNPLMGSTGQPFARNVQFAATFPELGRDELSKNRHGDRLGPLQPDPQLISRKLFTREQVLFPDTCRGGHGLPDYSPDANCTYQKANFFNVLAAFWIQFMTHDWFSHMIEGHNDDTSLESVGCDRADHSSKGAGEISKGSLASVDCRPGDQIDRPYFSESSEPDTFSFQGRSYLTRAYKTSKNNVTAWWDASQIYGYDWRSQERVKRDASDPAKLRLEEVPERVQKNDRSGYLPLLLASDPVAPQWNGQEAVAFPDNWTVGLSFYHNLFAREHNAFVNKFRSIAAANPDGDSGLRNPEDPGRRIRYRDVTSDELFQVARLVVAAEIAKIHTIEWTPQLLYNEPLYRAMNANWNGLLEGDDRVSSALQQIVVEKFGSSVNAKDSNQWYSVFASGAGIIGLGSHRYDDNANFGPYDPTKRDYWDISKVAHVNGGTNHFGSPFNFPEEFVSVYRLHALVPDLLEFRQLSPDARVIRNKIPVVDTFAGKATIVMRDGGLANWALSMGHQRLGLLTLKNDPMFLQNLTLPRLKSATGQIDVAALDIVRDREHGIPRFNEFRRQYGLPQLRSFDDFVNPRLPRDSTDRIKQERIVAELRAIYGQHVCDSSKIITDAQRNIDGTKIDDCLGFPNKTNVDNIEDVDTVVGWLAEFRRPHGFAISETQFQVFILNASRRLFSDRFFTSSFRPEFYSFLGLDWVTHNGPDGKVEEAILSNGHRIQVSPMKRVLLRNIPELSSELRGVVNVFDPWARDRGGYYSLQWELRPGAQLIEH